MKISGNNQNIPATKLAKEVKGENVQIDPTFVDVVDKKNQLLNDAVAQGNLSKTIAENIEKLRKEQPKEAGKDQVKDGETTKCYMPCYDEWGGGRSEEAEGTKCYMPCYDEWGGGRGTEEKGIFGPTILCYRAAGKEEKKILPGGGGPLCYAPMKMKDGPLCYAPMS